MNLPKISLVRFLYIFGLALMIAAIPLSRFFMSLAQFILAGVFLWDGIDEKRIIKYAKDNYRSIRILLIIWITLKEVSFNFIRRFGLFFRNKPALIFTSILLMHVVGLIYTTNFGYAMHDLRTKLPLFLLPLFISTSKPVGSKVFHALIFVYVGAVLAGTINGIILLLQQDIPDTRLITPMIHHIRFSLNVALASFLSFYLAFGVKLFPRWLKTLCSLSGVWLIFFLFVLKALSGLAAFIITAYILLLIFSFRSKFKVIKYSLSIALIIVPVIVVTYVLTTLNTYIKADDVNTELLEKETPYGNLYVHDTSMGIEEGRHIGLYICYDELETEWNKRSQIDFNGLDNKQQEIKYTLIRFLNSKDFRKDKNGIQKLTDDEIIAIENGVANYHYLSKFSINNRLRKFALALQQYTDKGAAQGYSSMERLEMTKAATKIISKNLLIGAGTGDLRDIFKNYYQSISSPFKDAKGGMHSSHNQFLNILVMFGLLGFVWFLFALIYPAIKLNRFSNFLFTIFFTIMIISFLGDDTLKSQAGVTFVAFFYSYFLFPQMEDEIEVGNLK